MAKLIEVRKLAAVDMAWLGPKVIVAAVRIWGSAASSFGGVHPALEPFVPKSIHMADTPWGVARRHRSQLRPALPVCRLDCQVWYGEDRGRARDPTRSPIRRSADNHPHTLPCCSRLGDPRATPLETHCPA